MKDKTMLAENQLLELLELSGDEEETVRKYLEAHGMQRLFYEYPQLPLSEAAKLKIGTIAQLVDCDGRNPAWRA